MRVLPQISTPLPRTVLVDTGAAMFKANVEGSDTLGYRVRLSANGLDDQPNVSDYYVVKEGSRYLVRAAGNRAAMGCEALYQFQKHSDKAAKQWLTWAQQGQEARAGDDPLRAQPFARLWADGKGKLE